MMSRKRRMVKESKSGPTSSRTSRGKKGLFEQVYEIVRKIPKGKVMTYGQIARQLGTRDPRKVGWALAANSDPDTPCHRVVNKEGGLAKNFGKSLELGESQGWEEQKRRLEAEGVAFLSEREVDLERSRVVARDDKTMVLDDIL